MTELRILLIDDHALFRSGMRLVLEGGLPGVSVIESDAIESIMAQSGEAPGLVLLDIQLQGMDGLDGLVLLKKRWSAVPVIMLSSAAETATVNLALAKGASAFFSKAGTAEQIIALIHEALGTAPVKAIPHPARARLTPRQFEVLLLVNEGLSNKAIARRLELSEFTVRGHVQAVLGLLDVSSRSQAIFAARGAGLLA
ncbi:MAG: two component transcriptional regulator, LuxR family [Polaromonas sp.]|nr:two component transcriptional regulator, LuxR family [Polaromonas sp.]